MADHYRVTLRAAIVARLTGLETTDYRVFANRIYPLQGDDLPGLTVKIDEPEIATTTIHGPATLERRLSVVVRGYDKATNDLALSLDTIGKEVEIALASSLTVGAKSVELILNSVQVDAVQADQPIGMIEMMYETNVYTLANAPEVLL
jgi:hypothetical protein